MISNLDNFQLSEPDLIASICRESFYEFIKEFWDQLIPETPVWNWHIKYLAEEMEKVTFRVIRREEKLYDVAVNVPPGTSKSTIISVMLHPWGWSNDPTLRFITGSYENDLALDFAVKSRSIITSKKYQDAFRFKLKLVKDRNGRIVERWQPSTDPDAVPITLEDDQNVKGHYRNMAQGERKSVGTGGMITGRHAHMILVDDPINPKAATSEAEVKAVNHWWDETLPSRKVDKALTPIVLVMQRIHLQDPSGHWMQKKKDKIRNICLPPKIRENISPARLVLKYKEQGGFLDPIRLSDKVLEEQLEDLGKYGYAAQYDQDPLPLGGGMFDVAMIQLRPRPPESHFEQIVRYWDKAGTKDAGANSAGVKLGLRKNGEIWILDCIAGQWSIPERDRYMRQTAISDGHHVRIYVEQEPGSGGLESAQNSIGDTFFGYQSFRDLPKGDKVTRAEPLAGQVGIGRVYVPSDASWWPAFRDEMRFFPTGKKDRIDAASAGFAKINRSTRRRVGAGLR